MTNLSLSDRSLLNIRSGEPADTALILSMIRQLAEFEKLTHEVVADESQLRATLFGPRRYAEVLIAERNGKTAAFAIFFHNYSTFLGRPGLHLEDLFVIPELRGLGIGERMLAHLATIAEERGCGRFEWSVLDWNQKAIEFYEKLGAKQNKGWLAYRIVGEPMRQLARRFAP